MICIFCHSFWQGLGVFLFTTISKMALGSTQPPIQWVQGALSLGVKQARCEADHSPPSSDEVKNVWSCTSTPQYAFMAWCSVKAQWQLYFYLYLFDTKHPCQRCRHITNNERILGLTIILTELALLITIISNHITQCSDMLCIITNQFLVDKNKMQW
jgi:hypothetical protein